MPKIVHNPEAEQAEPQLARPPLYQVIMLNDDFTPMDFVIDMLMQHFQKSAEVASQLMLQVHFQGRAVCGVYPLDIAESKVRRVESASRKEGHPLRCVIERSADE